MLKRTTLPSASIRPRQIAVLLCLGLCAGVSVFLVNQMATLTVGWWCWLAWPYGLMVCTLLRDSWVQGHAWPLACALAALQGPTVLVDAVYLHPDPQGPIALVLLPLLQLLVLLTGGLIIWCLACRSD